VAVTEPRRLAAVTVAERVAAERGEKVGGTVGYQVIFKSTNTICLFSQIQIRLESCVSPRTCLTFCTYGVLLRSLMGGDAILSSLTHVVVDEIHERDAMSDFLLTVLRDALARHRTLRLVLMSATVDTAQFLQYFPGCLHLRVGGNCHPVEEWPLELVLERTAYCSKEMRRGRGSQRTRRSLEDLTAQLALQGTAGSIATEEQVVEEEEEQENEDDVVIEGEEEEQTVDPGLDELLGRCFLAGAEADFELLAARLELEPEAVSYRHSVTGVFKHKSDFL
jgi:HrpA-like RNA helicase